MRLWAQSGHVPDTSTNFTRGSNFVARAAELIEAKMSSPSVSITFPQCSQLRNIGRPAGARLVQAAAGEIGVLAFQPMHDAGFEQRIQRPIDRNWREPRSLFRQPVQHFVSADAGRGRSDFLEHLAAQIGEPKFPRRK